MDSIDRIIYLIRKVKEIRCDNDGALGCLKSPLSFFFIYESYYQKLYFVKLLLQTATTKIEAGASYQYFQQIFGVPQIHGGFLSLLFNQMKNQFNLNSLPIRKRGSYLDKCPSIALTSNLFKVDLRLQGAISICAFKLKPNVDDFTVKEILKSSRHHIEGIIGPFIFSGRTLFTTSSKMSTTEVTFIIGSSPKYEMYIKKVRSVQLKNLTVQDKQVSGPVFLFLNNVIKNFMAQLDYTEIGKTRSYFDPRKKQSIDSAGIILFYGYSTRFDLRQNGLFLQINPATKIIRSQSVLQVINRIYAVNVSLNKTQKRLLIQEELVYKMVMSNYGKSKYYVIEDVIFDENIQTYKFQNKGVTLNLFQYYRQTYGITVQNKKQPLIKATSGQGKKKKTDIILIPEFMLMSGLPDNFDERKRREISERTITDPRKKLETLEGLMDDLEKGLQNFTLKSVEQNLGIKIDTVPYKLQAKRLGNPVLLLGGKERVQDNKVGGFMLFNKPLFDSNVVLKICAIYPKQFDLSNINNLMSSTCRNISLKYTFKTIPFVYSDAKKIQLGIEDLLVKQKATCNLFWFILPTTAKNHYKLIKKITLKDQNQKPTQISVVSTLQKKGFNSIFTKILLQMAAKVGNKLWAPRISDYVIGLGVMFISIQSYKDSDRKGMMIVAYCSTINSSMTAFNSNYFSQQNASALKMTLLIGDCLAKYIKNNKKPPGEVILFKNTSKNEGIILCAEIKEIEEALHNIPTSFAVPKLTYIIVDKNSKQQFYLERNNDVANPFYGTLVNSQVVGQCYDFYMVAQHCNRGTAKPTYYKVVYTNSQMEEGVLEQLVYLECFNYANWTGPVRVPGPLQYAKKLAMFIGQYICAEAQAQEVTDSLYYI